MPYQDLRLLGQAQHGVYNDELDSVDPALLYQYYGAATGSKDDYSSSDSDFDNLDDRNTPNTYSTNPNDNLSESESESESESGSASGLESDSSLVSRSESESSSVSRTSSTNSYSDSNFEFNPNADSESELEPTSQSTTSSGISDIDSGSDDGFEYGGIGFVPRGEDERITSQGIADIISRSQKHNIRHEAAAVAASAMPFQNKDEAEAFAEVLEHDLSSDEYPAGYGLNDMYESVETYKTGQSSKLLVIPLPHNVWFPRIIVWCKALDLLKRLPLCRDLTQ
jgi:hypothetical protein